MKFTNTITDENGRLIDVRVEEVADKRRGGGLQEFRETPGGVRQLKTLMESAGHTRQQAVSEPSEEEVDRFLLESFERQGFSAAAARVAVEGRSYPVPGISVSAAPAASQSQHKPLSEADRSEIRRLDALIEAGIRRLAGVRE